MSSEEKNTQANEDGLDTVTQGRYPVHILTVIGQIEGHFEANSQMKTTKYEHVIPQLVSVQENPQIKALMVILNTVGGDVEAGLAIAELIKSITKPTVAVVLGGGHSIGIPIAVAADRSFIVPTATMVVHPVRHSGTVLATSQTENYLTAIQKRVTDFVTENSRITPQRFVQLMCRSDELIMDMGTSLDGRQAVQEGLIDALGCISDAFDYLYSEIEKTED